MRNVHVGHDPVVIAHARHACVAGAADVQGAKLADGVAVTNEQLARLTRVFFVLRNGAYRVELENLVVFTNSGVAFNDAMRTDTRVCTNAHMGANDTVGPDLNAAV